MKIKTNVKAGGIYMNRCETLKVRTGVRAGGMWCNRCDTFARRISSGQ